MTGLVIIRDGMSKKFTPTQQIIKRWPSRQELAGDIGVDLFAVHRWFQRSSIPAKHDIAILDAASRRNIPLNWRELMEARSSHSEQGGHCAASIQDGATS